MTSESDTELGSVVVAGAAARAPTTVRVNSDAIFSQRRDLNHQKVSRWSWEGGFAMAWP